LCSLWGDTLAAAVSVPARGLKAFKRNSKKTEGNGENDIGSFKHQATIFFKTAGGIRHNFANGGSAPNGCIHLGERSTEKKRGKKI